MELPANVRNFLEEKPRFAVLATVQADGSPHQSVMWFDLVGNEVLMNTKPSRVKAANLRRNSAMSVCVEDGFRYVTLYGKGRFIDDPTVGQQDIHRLAVRYVGPEQAEEMARNNFSKETRVTLRMPIEKFQAMGL